MKPVEYVLVALLVGACGGTSQTAPRAETPADETPPASMACGELDDPARREAAINALDARYREALDASGGDHGAEGPRAVAESSVACLSSVYLAHRDDTTNGLRILEMLDAMNDPRALPALIGALDWRAEETEEHAIRAGRGLQHLALDEGPRGDAIEGLSRALARIDGARGVDNRMRIEFLRALGGLGDRRATPALVRVALLEAETQDFLINRLAFEELGKLEDPAAIPALIEGLYVFGPNNPALRSNDVAATGLVRIGAPAVEPLLATLRGENTAAIEIVRRYIDAVRARDASAADSMSVEAILSGEACFALGQIGLPAALDALIAESRATDPMRSLGAAIAMVSIPLEGTDAVRVREALVAAYARADQLHALQILVAMQHLIDPGLLPFFLEQTRPTSDGEESLDRRFLAARAYAHIANRAESLALRRLLGREQDEYMREMVQETIEPLLGASDACDDQDLACWQARLADSTPIVARKATYMLSRYGRGDPATISALVAHIGYPDEEVRGEVLYALDHVATAGSAEAVQAIDALREEEQGRAIWHHIESLALVVQARLAVRAR